MSEPPPAPPAASTSATIPANESRMPAHCRPLARSLREKTPSRATKIGIVAIRIAASDALVRAIPVFSKLK